MLLDFGSAWDEHEADPLTVRVRPFDATEEEITLPGSMPAGLRLHMWAIRSDAGDGHTLTYGELQAAGRFLFGAETFQRWLDQRITEKRLTACVMSVAAEYASRERREDAPPGEALGASEAPETSSPTSTPSKPTSSGPTESTSATSGG